MTTVIFKNGVLAADRRSSMTHHTMACLHCGSDRSGKEVSKIYMPYRLREEKHSEFRGELVRAIASSGKANWCDAMRNAVRRGEDIEAACQFLWDAHLRSSDNPEGVSAANLGSSIIVTTEHVWLYKPSRGPGGKNAAVGYPIDTKEVITIGSGGPYAHMAAVQLGHGPVTACAIAGIHDDHTGQTIDWVRMRSTEKRPVTHQSVFNFPTTYRIYD